MVKKIYKYLLIVTIAILSQFILFAPKYDAAELILDDEADILSNYETQKIHNLADKIDNDDIIFVVLTTEEMNGYVDNQNEFFLTYLQQYNYDESNNILGLTINMYHRLYDVYVYGAADEVITREETDIIIDMLSSYLKDEEYVDAIDYFFSSMNKAYNGEYRKPFNVMQFIVIFCIGAIISAITASSIYATYKKKLTYTPYPSNFMTLNLTNRTDVLLRRNTTRTYISSSSSHGGGGGGHGSSGGGHRGGGSF